MMRRPPRSTHFPYTTRFRSLPAVPVPVAGGAAGGTGLRGREVGVLDAVALPRGGPPGRYVDRPADQRPADGVHRPLPVDRKSTRLNSSHANISYAVFCLTKQ